jgi:two-component system LytT family response regulator
MRLRTVIADDEQLARDRLRSLLSVDGSVEVTGECRSGRELIGLLRSEPVDLLFLDIEMPGGSGFEVVEQVGAARMPPTVFVTAHTEHAVRAFEVHAVDYLTKPVELSRLQAALEHVRERIASKAALMTQEQLVSLLAGLNHSGPTQAPYPRRLLVPDGARDCFVDVSNIEWIEAADYYVCLHVGGRRFMLRESIKQLAATLDPAQFVRIHRSIIVNVDLVREILREGRGEGWVVLAGGQRLKMSKVGWQSLLAASRT